MNICLVWKRNCLGMDLLGFYNNFLMRITQKWILTYCSILFYFVFFLKWLKYLGKYINKLAADLWNFKQQILKFTTHFHLVKALNFMVNIIWTFQQCKFLRLTKKLKRKGSDVVSAFRKYIKLKIFQYPSFDSEDIFEPFFFLKDSTTINISTNDM